MVSLEPEMTLELRLAVAQRCEKILAVLNERALEDPGEDTATAIMALARATSATIAGAYKAEAAGDMIAVFSRLLGAYVTDDLQSREEGEGPCGSA